MDKKNIVLFFFCICIYFNNSNCLFNLLIIVCVVINEECYVFIYVLNICSLLLIFLIIGLFLGSEVYGERCEKSGIGFRKIECVGKIIW